MARMLFPLALAAVTCVAQPTNISNLPPILTFEAEQSGGRTAGWMGGPPGTLFVDDEIFHGGKWSGRIERNDASPQKFSAFTTVIPMDFTGKTIELHGFIRTENVSDYVGLWMREDGDTTLAFDNMQKRQLKGTTDWTEYSIVLPLQKEAKLLYFGFLLAGTGKGWVDDLRLLVDGNPVWNAPKVEQPKTILDEDHEFDQKSGVTLTELSPIQIENLAALGKVWGFLKYHHPVVTSGKRHWDYELFRVLPALLKAQSRAEGNESLVKWIDGLGEASACSKCANLDTGNLHLRPNLDWISNEQLLGKELSLRLGAVYKNRSTGNQFYVSLTRNVENASFDHELAYAQIRQPDAGFQLLAAYRFWNVIEYWFPYRDVMGEDWDKVLAQFIPRVALANAAANYQRELMALIAHAHDTHANLWSSLSARPPVGNCQVPILVRFIENRPVVTGYASESGKSSGLKIGDILSEMDGKSLPELIAEWTPYYADSNDAARQRDMAMALRRGACGPAPLRVVREGESVELKAERVPPSPADAIGAMHDLPGEAFRLLSPDVAYVKLSGIKSADAVRYITAAAGTKGLIIDNRGYPSDFPIFALGQLLVDRETQFARFTVGDLANPGAFHWQQILSLKPEKPHYGGKIVVLVDETTQSSAEYHSMAFRSAPQATVIGSMTAGADGNISPFSLPGGLRSMVSGIGVFYPDKRPTQRVGIVPDQEVKPTIAGIRAGRDEVLEAALRKILGPEVSTAEIEKLARTP